MVEAFVFEAESLGIKSRSIIGKKPRQKFCLKIKHTYVSM